MGKLCHTGNIIRTVYSKIISNLILNLQNYSHPKFIENNPIILNCCFKVIVVDKNQFRPSSNWIRNYVPECVASHPKFIENNPIILYVTNEDSKYLSNVENLEQGTVWVTTKDRIPKPRWSCEPSCISSPKIR